MNIESNNNNQVRTVRTNRLSTTLTIGAITLIVGVVIGGAAAENGCIVPPENAGGAAPNLVATTTPGDSPTGATNSLNPFQQMRQMQAQMNKMFTRMTERFQSEPGLKGFTDIPGYSLSLDVRDLPNRYQVSAYLPNAQAANVHVSLKNDRTLNVQVSNQTASQTKNVSGADKSTTDTTEWGQYAQTIQLPSPVNADQMKVQRDGHELIITIPKEA